MKKQAPPSPNHAEINQLKAKVIQHIEASPEKAAFILQSWLKEKAA